MPARVLRISALIALAALCAALPAQKKKPPPKGTPESAPEEAPPEGATLGDLVAVQEWIDVYQHGAFRLQKEGKDDPEALAKVDALCATLARWNTLGAAKKLFEVATIDPLPEGMHSSMDRLDFDRELQPWKVRETARKHIAKMAAPGLQDWLLAQIESRGEGVERLRRDAALRIVAERGGKVAEDALKRATQTLLPSERVVAIQVLAQAATLASVPHLLQLTGDSEPNARIAALNSIGKALGPLLDETKQDGPSPEAAAASGPVLDKLKTLLVRDPVWQVRAAAAECCGLLRCKAAIPVLIAGLEAELARAKEPWAVDLRIHKLLEGMTGQKVLAGEIRPWKEFWKKEAATFTFASTERQKQLADQKAEGRYQKFFNLEIDSRRVLFVLDFSGSMAEPANVKPKSDGGTGVQKVEKAGVSGISKAQLVIAELKKMLMAMPDGSLFNMIVFSDQVRCWRPDGQGRPTLVKLDDTTRDDLMGSFLDSLAPRGPTNLYGALDKALDLAGRGLYDKWYATSFDTLYVLSDGAPSHGKVQDKQELCRIVREANALKKVVINTVTFGEMNDTLFLKQMAEENGGRHIHVE